MYERYSDASRRVIVLSEQEAKRLGHGHLGTEHLLLGVLGEKDSDAAALLREMGASVEGCREMAREAVGNRGGPGSTSPLGELVYTERAGRSLDRAARLALRRHDPLIEPHHILLSVLDVEGRAGLVLRGLGVDFNTLRRRLQEGRGELPITDTKAPPSLAPTPATPTRLEGRPTRRTEPPTSDGPLCPKCSTLLEGRLAHRVVSSDDEVRFLLAYCGRCGTTLGATPV